MKRKLSIYLVHPISGLTYEQVNDYYNEKSKLYSDLGFEVYHPMTGKKQLRPEVEYKAHGVTGNPVASNHAIFERDGFMCRKVDILFADLIGCKGVSIGSCMELAIGSCYNKHTVVAMEKDNPHMHAFVLEAADTIFETEPEAREYLRQLIGAEEPSINDRKVQVATEGCESVLKIVDNPEVSMATKVDAARDIATSMLDVLRLKT